MRGGLRFAAAACILLCSGTAYCDTEVYGRINLSLEHRTASERGTTILQDNTSRVGFVGEDALDGGVLMGFRLEHEFDATSGADAAPVFWNRRAEMSIAGSAGMLRIGRFASEPYLTVADAVSMHNHDNGSSADALYADVGNGCRGALRGKVPT